MLHSTIQKPSLTFSDDPAPIEAFLGILSIFEALPPDLYNWLCIPRSEMQHQASSVPGLLLGACLTLFWLQTGHSNLSLSTFGSHSSG